MIGAARIEQIPSNRQISTSTRVSNSALSQRRGLASRTQAPLNPLATSTDAPTCGALLPTDERQVIPFSPSSATAAPVPRVMEQARLAISVRAAFKSPPRDLNSYCTVVETAASRTGPEPPVASAPDSRLNATPNRGPLVISDPRENAES